MTLKPIDDKAYAVIVDLIDEAEETAVKNGRCAPEQASAYVTHQFILCAAGIVQGATVYLPNDDRIGADIFLIRLPNAATRLASSKRRRVCAELLTHNPSMFFPLFNVVLRYTLHHTLASITDANELATNGIALLAAARLPGSISDTRRRIRMLGGSNRLLVCDNDLDRMANSFEYLLPNDV